MARATWPGWRPGSATRSTWPGRASSWPGSTSPTPGTRRTCPTSPRRDRARTRGPRRLEAAEEAVRAAHPGDRVTVIVLTSDPAEIGRLVRLRVSDLTGCLRRVFAPGQWPRLRLVLDDGALAASAVGLPDADDATEAAVRIQDGRIVARAQGRGAAHAAATAGASTTTRPDGTRA